MLSNLASKLGITSSSSSSSFVIKPRNPSKMEDLPRQVKYTSSDVVIPDSFLTTPPAAPITSHHIDFASSPLPQYEGHTALILDNVLSPQECRELLSLAEASVPRPEGSSAWRPALVNLGAGWEAPAPGYRESDRIIWDQQTIVDRLWERCAQAEGLRELLAVIPPDPYMRGGKWKFSRFNERMRYLKYTPGQYFKPHCDGPYYYTEGEGIEYETFYTVHLYLNDSKEHNPESDLEGGATSFLEMRGDNRLDVNPKQGSVLIFQHKGLYHEGATVLKGTKYTMRTDILYKWVPDNEETPEGKDD
ncbi:P4Hc domain-containing protein [Fusarium keratoplasticum]|uniref:P4Hc domain-containing protein n=1 Tax=Fusarium keratoplasticum TaxID=1328300 RepID=A0ACC0QIL4_9HYPO|nr:P4Hc domain-containing protein [Fusarium keratoplasticum]KAI8654845.1 P4Hc domain-containing protein [Fusarium keratoplasticum]KAI8655689.1 P4Hc domain-containing protein [Fusarium keratoplasticum]